MSKVSLYGKLIIGENAFEVIVIYSSASMQNAIV